MGRRAPIDPGIMLASRTLAGRTGYRSDNHVQRIYYTRTVRHWLCALQGWFQELAPIRRIYGPILNSDNIFVLNVYQSPIIKRNGRVIILIK